MPIWNRESILELLSRELARSASSGKNLTVILAGIDPVKNAEHSTASQNNTLGAEVSTRLSSILRSYDYMGRYEQNQFLILVPESDAANALPLAEKLRLCVAAKQFDVSGFLLQLTVSVVCANSSRFSSYSQDAALRQMQAALDKMQAGGGNRAELLGAAASPNIRRATLRRIRMSWLVAGIFLTAIAILILLAPSWTCAPNLVTDIFDSAELPPPHPADCVPGAERPSDATIQTIESQREADGLELQGTVTCKMAAFSKSKSKARGNRDQQWLGTLYTDGRLQYRRHVLIAASEDVPGGKLFTVEQCLMPWWKYLLQWKQYCRAEDMPWE